MATNFVKKWQTPHFRRCGIQKGNGISLLNVCINSINDASISCENFMNFGPVTPELTELICERLVRHGQKLVYLVEYIWIYWTNFHNLFTE